MCSPHIFYVWIVSQRMVTCVWAAKVKCAASPCIFSLSSTFISSVYMSAAILVMKLHDVIKQIHRQSSSSTTELVELSLSRLLQWINLSSRSAREDWNEFSRKSSLRTCVCHLHLFTNKKKWRLRRQHRKKERESRHISSSSHDDDVLPMGLFNVMGILPEGVLLDRANSIPHKSNGLKGDRRNDLIF